MRISQLSSTTLLGAALAAIAASNALATLSSSKVFRGTAWMHRQHSVVSFRVTAREVVDFQLAGLDVQEMPIRWDGRFAGCNRRTEAFPCVYGQLNRARSHASGYVSYGRHGRWRFSARAIGTNTA